ncbi:MAG: type II toxin-antitoxin system VapC family toxin [Acidobacteria bacterium]|nr:type II toxin-antitoxin system VapC family toxin [Acidobacteriota bacterium]
MRYLLDTNILLRLSQPNDPAYQTILDSFVLLQQQPGIEFCFFLQNLAEFWNVCTRPADKNGYGFTIAETELRARAIEGFCVYLPDTPQVYVEWRQLVVKHGISGVQVHDARLAAGMKAHGITQLLTLNEQDFLRYATSGISAVTPDEVIQSNATPNP